MRNKNLDLHRWGKQRVVSSPDVLSGEPVFRGTRIPLMHIVLLFKKRISETEIVRDFPSLSARDLEYARLLAETTKKPRRPKKPLIFRRIVI